MCYFPLSPLCCTGVPPAPNLHISALPSPRGGPSCLEPSTPWHVSCSQAPQLVHPCESRTVLAAVFMQSWSKTLGHARCCLGCLQAWHLCLLSAWLHISGFLCVWSQQDTCCCSQFALICEDTCGNRCSWSPLVVNSASWPKTWLHRFPCCLRLLFARVICKQFG